MEKSYTTKNIKECEKIAKRVLDILHKNNKNIILLIGELGSSKTTFVKCIAKLLGIKKTITSPTFLISKEYKIPKATCNPFDKLTVRSRAHGRGRAGMQHATSLIHYDLYRLRSLRELEEIGFWEKIIDKKKLIFIEWPDKINKLIRNLSKKVKYDIISINFFHTNNINQRKITIKI